MPRTRPEKLTIDDPTYRAWKKKRDDARMLAGMLAGDDAPPRAERSTTRLVIDAYRPFLIAAGAVLVFIVLLAVWR